MDEWMNRACCSHVAPGAESHSGGGLSLFIADTHGIPFLILIESCLHTDNGGIVVPPLKSGADVRRMGISPCRQLGTRCASGADRTTDSRYSRTKQATGTDDLVREWGREASCSDQLKRRTLAANRGWTQPRQQDRSI